MLVIEVIGAYGNPVTGLVQSDFSLGHIQSPSGSGPSIPDLVTCPGCFADRGDGTYRSVVYRSISSSPWLAGSWITRLEVTLGQKTAYELVNIEIPEATAP